MVFFNKEINNYEFESISLSKLKRIFDDKEDKVGKFEHVYGLLSDLYEENYSIQEIIDKSEFNSSSLEFRISENQLDHLSDNEKKSYLMIRDIIDNIGSPYLKVKSSKSFKNEDSFYEHITIPHFLSDVGEKYKEITNISFNKRVSLITGQDIYSFKIMQGDKLLENVEFFSIKYEDDFFQYKPFKRVLDLFK